MEQYRKFDSIKALYNLILHSLLRNFDTLFIAFICRDALEQITEICFWNRNLSSMWIPKSFTQSLVCTLHPFISTIMGSVLGLGFIIIAWNLEAFDFIWFESNHLMAILVQFTTDPSIHVDQCVRFLWYYHRHNWIVSIFHASREWDR